MSTQPAVDIREIRPSIGYWMERVLREAENASIEFAPDPVHDLRVALRRCRSLAAGYMVIDPDKTWRSMTKEGRRLFKRLGDLRDVQVMESWVRSHGELGDPFFDAMMSHLERTEQEVKLRAERALREFNSEKWSRWVKRLQRRARRIPLGGAVFQLSALKACEDAYNLHRQALRNRSARAYHRLRIGLKKFRYMVENFLPLRHAEWSQDLKQLQDWLGEIHDLTVIADTAKRLHAFDDTEGTATWRSAIQEEKAVRLENYRNKMIGARSLWNVWRQGFPPANRQHTLGLAMIQKWACFRGVQMNEVRSVRRLALQLYDGLTPRRRSDSHNRSRRTALHLAVLLRGLNRGKRKGISRESLDDLVESLPPIPGFSADLLHLAAAVARLSDAKFPEFDTDQIKENGDESRGKVGELAGILRLAATLARESDTPIQKLLVERTPESIIIRIQDYSELDPLAEKAARARYLLEYSCRHPVLIRGFSALASGSPALNLDNSASN